jgi:hypothetical protein
VLNNDALEADMSGMARRVQLAVLAVVVVTAVLLGVSWAAFAQRRAETWVAVVSDAACGAEHSEEGRGDCVRKCARGGAAIGHPEWTPQELVLVRVSDRSVWRVDNFGSLQGLEGRRVKVEVEADAEKKIVHVKNVAADSDKEKVK